MAHRTEFLTVPEQRLNVCALLMPKAQAGHGKPVPQIVRPQRLAVIEACELTDLSKTVF